jgi:flagellar hook-basal body complex protein FliE
MAVIGPAERLNQILAHQQNIQQGGFEPEGSKVKLGAENPEISFGDTLKGMVSSINDLQVTSEDTATRFVAGQVDDVHDAMVAMEKAALSFQFMVEVRNRLVEGYQQVMRMHV